MFQAILFDLDNCLSAAAEIGEHVYLPAMEAVRQANRGTLREDVLDAAFADCWYHALDYVADKYGFSDTLRAAAWAAFAKMEMHDAMSGYGDLALLSDFKLPLFLVTSGFRRLQESKIRALGIAARFREIHIDAIDEAGRLGKAGLFADIVTRHGLPPGETLVVGDNPDSEIAAGNRLGMPTVQMLRPGVTRSGAARFHVHNLAELCELIETLKISSPGE